MGPSVYVHVPFCLSKCRYCGFNSVPLPGDGYLESYCGALVPEIGTDEPIQETCDTVYFGGGTPSLLSPGQAGRILGALRSRHRLAADAELTIEANPETLPTAKVTALRQLGFNRLSLGVQSFDDGLLRLMGRPHDSAAALRAFRQARQAGFANIGVDLIFGLPGQTPEGWQADLGKALELAPEHLSLYALSYEVNSEFGVLERQGGMRRVPEDAEADMYESAIALLTGAGYRHYEVSNFARPGFESRHNLNYWRCGDYRGYGAGAHSHRGGRRWANDPDPAGYVRRIGAGHSPVTFEETLTRDQQLFEAVFLGLRMREGINVAEFTDRWGVSPYDYLPEMWEKLALRGLMVVREDTAFLTREGFLLSDLCLSEFTP